MSSTNNISGNSRIVTSNQDGVHPDLEMTVSKYVAENYQRPVADYCLGLLEEIKQKQQAIGGKLILDSGCGTGVSTYNLAELYPNDLVVGIDQSDFRLNKNKTEREAQLTTKNVLLLRANVIDLWLLMAENNWQIDRHYLFYPNPWPKKKHLQRRWHGHPVFPTLLKLGGKLELRSNWKLYVDEFCRAVEVATGKEGSVELLDFIENPITPFEKKYQLSKQSLYRYQTML